MVRLVKGAYWDHEIVEARQHGWTPPVFEEKAESDRNFERLTRRLLEGWPHVRPAIASHNLRSVAHAVAANRAAGRADRDLELQVLRGLGDDLAAALADQGMRVRIYCPVGDMVAGMAYLVRRLLENTANESFLERAAARRADRGAAGGAVTLPQRADPRAAARAGARGAAGGAARARRAAAARGAGADRRRPRRRQRGWTPPTPGRPRGWWRRAGRAGAADAEAAVEAAQRGFRDWGARPAAERAAGAARRRGAPARAPRSSWPPCRCASARSRGREADADVCEAIDFLEYYARAGDRAGARPRADPGAGRAQPMRYVPRGVAAVIAPWNFPLAIPCGMTAAALAAGNAAVLKPAEQSPASAGALVEALHEGGRAARTRCRCCPGYGDAGAALVRDPRVHVIAFTGSSAVGPRDRARGGRDARRRSRT